MSDPSPHAEPPTQFREGVLEADISCVQCTYNLRGLNPAAVCPECGAPIARSLSNLPSVTLDMWVALRRALLLVIIANIAIVGLAIAALTRQSFAGDVSLWVFAILYLILAVLRASGYSTLASITLDLSRPPDDGPFPFTIRCCAITKGTFGLLPAVLLLAGFPGLVGGSSPWITVLLIAAACLALVAVVQFYAVLGALERIAGCANLIRLRGRVMSYGSACAVGVMPGALFYGLGLVFAWIAYHILLFEFLLKASAVAREHRISTGASST